MCRPFYWYGNNYSPTVVAQAFSYLTPEAWYLVK
jgi:hypothetical protein